MAITTIHECDHCRGRINGRAFHLTASVIYVQGSVEVERDTKGEYCSPGCLQNAVKALVDEVQSGARVDVRA